MAERAQTPWLCGQSRPSGKVSVCGLQGPMSASSVVSAAVGLSVQRLRAIWSYEVAVKLRSASASTSGPGPVSASSTSRSRTAGRQRGNPFADSGYGLLQFRVCTW